MTPAQHLYLRVRLRWRRGWILGAALYPAASLAGYVLLLQAMVNLDLGLSGVLIWSLQEGLPSWLAMALASRMSERAAPAPTPPAPNA